MTDSTPKTTSAKPTKIEQPLQAAAQNGSSQATEAFGKMRQDAAESTELFQNCYVTGLKGAHEYNAKVMEFAKSNTEAVVSFAKTLSDVKSPSEFLAAATDYSRKQFDSLTEQTRDLTALAQRVTLATVEPLKAGVSKAFGQVN